MMKANATRGSRRRIQIRGERHFDATQIHRPETSNPIPLAVRYYDDLAEWCFHAEWWLGQCGTKPQDRYGPWTSHPEFPTFEDAWNAMEEGRAPSTFLAQLDSYRGTFVETIEANGWAESRRRRLVWGDDGDEANVDRVLVGHERPFRRSVAGRMSQVIRLGLDSTALGAWEGGQFARVGGLLAAIAETIERQGRSVEITLIETENSDRRGTHYVHACTLKHASDPVDLERIGAVSSPLFARIVCLVTDIFDAGQYSQPVRHRDRPNMAEELGLDAIVGLYTSLDSLRPLIGAATAV
jgi:hypothetical protein